jgi:hypothetical protein
MTGSTADAIGEVFRLGKVLGLQARLMALGTNGSGLCRTQRLEADDLGDIAATFNVGLCWAMTRLASMLVALEQRSMRSVGKVLLPNLLVTRFADVVVRILGSTRTWERG